MKAIFKPRCIPRVTPQMVKTATLKLPTVKLPGRSITSLAKMPEKTMLDELALAAALRVSKRTIRRMVSRYELPPPFRFAGKSTWLVGKVLAHIEARAERKAQDAERAVRKLESLI